MEPRKRNLVPHKGVWIYRPPFKGGGASVLSTTHGHQHPWLQACKERADFVDFEPAEPTGSAP